MWEAIATFKTALTYALYVSVKTGQIIVTVLLTILNQISNFLLKFWNLLTVIVEDFCLFANDVLQNIYYIYGTISFMFGKVIDALHIFCLNVIQLSQILQAFVINLRNVIGDSFFSVFNGGKNVLIGIKRILVLFGDGVWFVVFYLPKSFMAGCELIYHYTIAIIISATYYFTDCMQHVYNAIFKLFENCFDFFTDVPLESVIGLIIAFCFACLIFQFYRIIVRFLRRSVISLLRSISSTFGRIRINIPFVKLFRRRPSYQIIERGDSQSHKVVSDDAYCIICSDKAKCVLVLPCKHLCMCLDCTPRLMRYSGRCPICRQRINSTMRIFT